MICAFSSILRSLEVLMQFKEITQSKINLELLTQIQLTTEQKEQIEIALSHSPTGGNSKPFTWQWMNNTLCVSHDKQLAAHYLNRNNHTSYLALGCIIASVEVTAAELGLSWKASFNEENLYSEIQFFAMTGNHKDRTEILYPMISKRHTYRGAFKTAKQLSNPEFTLTDTEVFNNELVSRNFVSSKKVSQQFKSYLLKAESYMWVQLNALKDFLKEIRFFSAKSSFEERGIPTHELDISIVDEVMLAALKIVPVVLSWMRRIPVINIQMIMAAKKTAKNSNFCLFSAKDTSASSLVQVGRVAMLTWLDLELQGYKVQPISMAVIPMLDAATGQLPQDTRPEFQKLFTDSGVQSMSEQFQLSQEQTPVWLFRFGEAVK